MCTSLHCRYLGPANLTVGQFIYEVRKRIKLSAAKDIFVFVKNMLPPTGETQIFFYVILSVVDFRFLQVVLRAQVRGFFWYTRIDQEGFFGDSFFRKEQIRGSVWLACVPSPTRAFVTADIGLLVRVGFPSPSFL